MIPLIAFRLVAPAGVHSVVTLSVLDHVVSSISTVFKNESRGLGHTRGQIVVQMSIIHKGIITTQADITRAFS